MASPSKRPRPSSSDATALHHLLHPANPADCWHNVVCVVLSFTSLAHQRCWRLCSTSLRSALASASLGFACAPAWAGFARRLKKRDARYLQEWRHVFASPPNLPSAAVLDTFVGRARTSGVGGASVSWLEASWSLLQSMSAGRRLSTGISKDVWRQFADRLVQNSLSVRVALFMLAFGALTQARVEELLRTHGECANFGPSQRKWCFLFKRKGRDCLTDPAFDLDAFFASTEGVRKACQRALVDYGDKDAVLACVKELGAEVLRHTSAALRGDGEFMLAVMDRVALPPTNWRQSDCRRHYSGGVCMLDVRMLELLEYASTELRADKEFIRAAIKRSWLALKCASSELRGDREIVLAAVAQNGLALDYASAELHGNRDIVLTAVTQHGELLKRASSELRGDRDIVLAAIAQNGYALRYAPDELRGDREIVLTAVSQNGHALEYSSAELRGDRDIVLAAVAQNLHALKHASAELHGDRDIVLAAVKQDGKLLKSASAELRGDRDVVLAAVTQHGKALMFASTELRGDRNVVLAAVSQNGHALQYASVELRGDRDIVLAANSANPIMDRESYSVTVIQHPYRK